MKLKIYRASDFVNGWVTVTQRGQIRLNVKAANQLNVKRVNLIAIASDAEGNVYIFKTDNAVEGFRIKESGSLYIHIGMELKAAICLQSGKYELIQIMNEGQLIFKLKKWK